MLRLSGLLTFLAAEPLLAAGNKGFGSNRGQLPNTGLDLLGLLLALGGVLLVAFLAWGFSYWQKRRESSTLDSPRALFRELCTAHGLNRADRDLLYEIAQWHEISDPVRLFVEPRRFQPKEMHQSLDCECEAQDLEARLFGNAERGTQTAE